MSRKVRWPCTFPSRWKLLPSKQLFPESKERAIESDEQLSATQDYGVIAQSTFMRLAGRRVVQLNRNIELRKRVEVGDFVISMRSFQGGLERAWIAGGIRSSYVVLRPREDLIADYYQQLFKSEDYIQTLQSTSNFIRDGQDLNYQNFVLIDLPLPPVSEQRTIAAFLKHETAQIDALIAEQERLIALLKEKRQAVISHAVTKGCDHTVQMKDSDIEWLGEVPKHWKVVALKHLVSQPIIDGPHESPQKQDDGIPFISAESIGKGFIDFDKKWGYISEDDHNKYSQRYKPQRNDILLVKLGATTGVPAIVETDVEFNVWVPLAAIRLKPYYNSRFIFHVLQSDNLRVAYELNWTYGTQQTLGLGTISNLRMPLPDLKEQRGIVEYLNSILPKLHLLEFESEQTIKLLRERRSALISAAVTGKIDVRNWQPPADSHSNTTEAIAHP